MLTLFRSGHLVILAIIAALIFAIIIIGNVAIKICDIVRYLTSSPEQRKKYKKEQAKRDKEWRQQAKINQSYMEKQQREEQREIDCSREFERGLEDGEHGSSEGYHKALAYCTRKHHINRETYAYYDGYMLGYQ